MKKILSCISVLYLLAFSVNAEDIGTVEGQIFDNNSPVRDLTVQVAGTNKKGKTNKKGIFKIRNVSFDNDTLIIGINQDEPISELLSEPISVPLQGASMIDIRLMGDTVFITKEKKEKPLQSVYGGTLLTRDMLEKTGETNLLKAIALKAAGVDYVNNNLIIRGAKSLLAPSPDMSPFERDAISRRESPLYIVNGMEVMDASFYSVMEVDSVEILKDTATSIFGAKGGNGVVIINLRK